MSATYPDECRAPPLKKQLDDTRKAKLKQVGHVKSAPGYDPVFFPRDVIEEVLSRDKVEFVLSCPCNWCEKDEGSIFRHFNCGKRIDYIDFVTNRALRLFALLVYVGLPALIVGFLRTADAILDEDLDMERLKKTHLKGFERINSVPLTAFTGLLDLFLIHRHEFSPPVLEGGWSEQWDPKKALPFINTRFVGKGGYGTVYSFQIYPGYEKFKFEVSTGFAMKEVGLPAQSGSMNAEAETLTKIREELGDEKHIIKVLKIFRRGDKLHFIFPLARGNLEKFMEEPWKHQPNTCDSICQNTIWDEAVGMLKALAKFHRPPGMTSWRGYHADIKPTNILVFDDGTMVITDFGQALIAQKRSSEKTRRILQRPGEQAYRPPENSKESFMGPEYDDWAMGCVLLEILVFAIKGPRGVWELKNARQKTQYPTDYYYQVRDDQRFIHPEVEELLGGLASEVASWSVDVKFTVAALEIVKSMLRINHKTRMDSGEAASQLREKLNYWRNQANRGRRTSSNRSGPACPETSWPPNADQRLSKQFRGSSCQASPQAGAGKGISDSGPMIDTGGIPSIPANNQPGTPGFMDFKNVYFDQEGVIRHSPVSMSPKSLHSWENRNIPSRPSTATGVPHGGGFALSDPRRLQSISTTSGHRTSRPNIYPLAVASTIPHEIDDSSLSDSRSISSEHSTRSSASRYTAQSRNRSSHSSSATSVSRRRGVDAIPPGTYCPSTISTEHHRQKSTDSYATPHNRPFQSSSSPKISFGKTVRSPAETQSLNEASYYSQPRASDLSISALSMGAISQCQTRINGDEKEIYLSPKCGFSNGDGKNNEGKVLFVASKTGGPLSIRPHDNSNGLLEVVSVLADAPMIPAFAFILPDPGVEMKDYKIQVGPFSLFLPTRKDAHELHEVLTKQHIHISVRATVKLERRKKHALALKSAGPNLILKESLVQLWTEVGKPIHSREVWASQSNAPPQFVSRLVVFNTEEDDMFFVSIPLIDGDNHLQWSKDLGQRCITISRSLKAKIKGYKFAKTASGLPGIHMKKEKFEAHESNRNCEKYSTVHLEFVGDKAQTLIDFKEFRDCYNGLKKGRG